MGAAGLGHDERASGRGFARLTQHCVCDGIIGLAFLCCHGESLSLLAACENTYKEQRDMPNAPRLAFLWQAQGALAFAATEYGTGVFHDGRTGAAGFRKSH